MKKVYLTEEQYVDFVLNECSNFDLLNEGVFEKRNILATIFKGCRTFGDYARRIIYIASTGIIINVAVFRSFINSLPVGTVEQKQELLAQVENELQQDSVKQENDMTQYAKSFSISPDGIEHIKNYEKCRLKPYFATPKEKEQGIKTIGWGHKITKNDPEWLRKAAAITKEQADELFANDIHIYERELMRAINGLSSEKLKNPQIYPQSFIDVVISIIYNAGVTNLKATDFYNTWNKCRVNPDTMKIRPDDYNYTISKIPNTCVTQKGKPINGLKTRRNDEYRMANVLR